MVSGKKLALWGCLGCGGFVSAPCFFWLLAEPAFSHIKRINSAKKSLKVTRKLEPVIQALNQEHPFAAPEEEDYG